MTYIEREIRRELHGVLEKMGFQKDLLEQARAWGPTDFYEVLEAYGAPHRLLAVVGSWGDTVADSEVLAMLKTWNETGDLKFDRLIASTSKER